MSLLETGSGDIAREQLVQEMKTPQEIVDLINSGRGQEVGFYGGGIVHLDEEGNIQVTVATNPRFGEEVSRDIFGNRFRQQRKGEKMESRMKHVVIAEVVHEVNRAYCRSLGDGSQVPWSEAPAEIQKSAIDGVGFVLANPEVTPEETHQHWLDFKKTNGWVYGEKKDMEKKTHPCCVQYHELPEDQKVKDTIFRSVVLGMVEVLKSHLG